MKLLSDEYQAHICLWVSTASGDDFMQLGNRPSPDPMLSRIDIDRWGHKVTKS